LRNSSYARSRISRSIISTIKPLFIRLRIVVLVIILSAVFITLSVSEAPSSAPSLRPVGGLGSMQHWITNNTFHILDIYFDQYGEPMTGAVVSNSLTNSSTGFYMEKNSTINSHGYSLVNFKLKNPNLSYCASYNVPVLPPLNKSDVDFIGGSETSITPQNSNFTYNQIYVVKGRYSYETAFLFFHYNSNGYQVPDHEFRLFYTNNRTTCPPFGPPCPLNLPTKVVSGYINMGIIGDYTNTIVYPNYNSIPKGNLSKANLLFGFPQEYENGKWVNLTLSNYFIPDYVPEVYRPPTSELLTAPIYSVFFGFPSIIPVLLGILSEVVIFGLPKSSGSTDLYLSRSGSRVGLMLKRMVGSFILLLTVILLGFAGFLITIFYYTGVFPTPETDFFVLTSLFLVGVAFISLSFLISSRARSTTVNVLAPFAIFFGLYYLLDQLLVGLYPLMLTKGIVLSPLILYGIEVLDPFNVLTIMQVDLIPTTKVSIPVPFGFGLTDYIVILVMWSVIPALAALLLWKNAE